MSTVSSFQPPYTYNKEGENNDTERPGIKGYA